MRYFYIMKNFNYYLFIFTIFFSLNSFAQEFKQNYSVKWNDRAVITTHNSKMVTPLTIDNNFTTHFLPLFVTTKSINNNVKINQYSVKNIKYQTVNKKLFNTETLSAIPSKIKTIFKIVAEKRKRSSYFSIIPLINKNGVIKKITSFTLEYSLTSQVSPRSSIHNSPLSNGEWKKFAIDTTGVYKISKSFLGSLGININSIDPKKIKIYGNGGAMLNERNGDFRQDDLQENAIYVHGEEDGSFDSNDYILFYAQGPDIWKPNTNTLKGKHQTNIYSDKAYYFLTISNENGKRITPKTEVVGTPNTTYSNFNTYKLHELDEFNFGSFGQEFYGEKFQIENEQVFSFHIPDLDSSSPISVKVKTAATDVSNFDVLYNSTIISTINISSPGEISIGRTNSISTTINSSTEDFEIGINYNTNDPSIKAALDYIEINAMQHLIARDKQFSFRNLNAFNANGIIQYSIQNSENIFQIWDVTDKINIKSIANNSATNNFTFNTLGGNLEEYVLVNENDFYTPERIRDENVENQNLHALQDIEYLIICQEPLFAEAERLANYHEETNGLSTLIISPDKIYNEFSSGAQDLTAIRDFINHLYNHATSLNTQLKYVLFLGDTSYDFKNIENQNNALSIFAFQSLNSFHLANSYVTDDFFGMLDDDEGDFTNVNGAGDKLDIAVGRMPVKSIAEATNAINKTLNYYSKDAIGKWRNQISLIADDVDKYSELTLEQSIESIADNIKNNKPVYNIKKIYSDAFVQEISAGGARYPQANVEINNAVERGSLILDYFGHGGENGWGSERQLDINEINNWYNPNTLPLFITITCEFSRYDNPNRNTAGEYVFSNPDGGANAMITTGREVYIYFGEIFNAPLIANLLEFTTSNNYSISQVLSQTKNKDTFISNTQRFFIVFFGDPAMKLPIAKPNIILTEMNDTPIAQQLDTIKALGNIKLKGIITNNSNQQLTNFNGELFATIYDKEEERSTLNNDNNFHPTTGDPAIMIFDTRESKIFNGRASVTNGEFEFNFIAPRDIRIAYGNAKLSFYAKNNETDKSGYNTDIIIGGINEDAPEDNLGPTIQLYMNDESFIDGGNTNQSPLFLAVLEDESGINTSLTAVDHDIVAILDGDQSNPIILNDYYETELDDYTKGKVKFPFRDLTVGEHTITFKCWDTYNNSSQATLNFVVVSDGDLILDNVLNYPNPFINYTEFWFNHNKPNESLEIQVQIFTVSGKLIKTINQLVNSSSTLVRSLNWNGLDDYGNKVGKGVYVYKLNVKTLTSGLHAEKFEKLVILQ